MPKHDGPARGHSRKSHPLDKHCPLMPKREFGYAMTYQGKPVSVVEGVRPTSTQKNVQAKMHNKKQRQFDKNRAKDE